MINGVELNSMDKQIQSILKNKRTLLSSQGFAFNDVYYSALNSSVSLAEVTYSQGRTNYSLTSLVFGGSGQVSIPNGSLLGETSLVLSLPQVPANTYLPRGWGLMAINSLEFVFGSSNVSNLNINGQTLFQWIIASCATEEKRSEILNLCGEEQITTTTAPIWGYIPLILPFSKLCEHSKLPFDSNMLNSPIVVKVTFNSRSSFIGGSGSVAYASSFSSANIYLRQGDFSNKEMSLGPVLKSDPSTIYTYPFIHAQSYPTTFTGSTTALTSIPLQSFLNADLVSMTFGVVQTTDLTSPSNTGVVRGFNYERITNVSLLWNGQTVYTAPQEAYRLYNMNGGSIGSGKVLNTNPTTGTTSPFTTTPIDTYLITIDFGRIRSLCFEGQFQNVWRIGNQSLTLQFQTLTANAYSLFASYYYNGAIENSGGTSKIYFD
jgi:hypothetical protein